MKFNRILEDPTIELIVFDDFPGTIRDASIFQQITQNSLWRNSSKIYFEGPKSNASTGEILMTITNTDEKCAFVVDVVQNVLQQLAFSCNYAT